jgi:hypothetical protein
VKAFLALSACEPQRLLEEQLIFALLQRYQYDLRSSSPTIRQQAREWIASEEFDEWCDLLAIEPSLVRTRMQRGD